MSILVSIEQLLSGTVVEGTRMEFKEGWNPVAIMRTICAFANDFQNEGSGYIIIGVAEDQYGRAQRPVLGFDTAQLEKVQQELIGYCNQIQPSYMPRLSLEEIDGKHVLVIWVIAGSFRPYKVPDDVTAKHKIYNYRIRQFSSSVVPSQEQAMELQQLTSIPFDDRPNIHARIEDMDYGMMREHLYQTKSKLHKESSRMDVEELARAMNLCEGADEHLFPKNIGLLMFSTRPNAFFHCVQIDVVVFPHGVRAKQFREKTFDGAIQKQLVDALSYLKTNIIESKVIKFADRAEADTVFNYPYEALEEALANAVYHRNYEIREPIEVRVEPRSIIISSFSGVDPALKQEDFDKGKIRIRRYRNRRIGSFLKELKLTEGRGTGIPTIFEALHNNGSPAPIFDTDEPRRSYFLIEIPIHPEFEPPKFAPSPATALHDEGLVEGLVEDSVIETIKKDFGSLSYRLMLDASENIIFLRGNYQVFRGYLRAKYELASEQLRNNFEKSSEETGKSSEETASSSEEIASSSEEIEKSSEETGKSSEETRESSEETRESSEENIPKILLLVLLVAIEPKITATEAGRILESSSRMIEKYLKRLKELGVIERIGATKQGSWIIK